MARVRYLGHSGVEITLGGVVALIDLYTGADSGGRERLIPNAFNPAEARGVDFVFMTHEHFDHCDPAAVEKVSERTFAKVVGPKPALDKINVNERMKIEVRTGDKFSLKGLDVRVVKAVHPQSAYPVGFVLAAGGQTVYHAGDTYKYPEQAEIKCDIALLPIGGTYTMDASAAADLCKEMRPKIVVPIHYGTFEQIQIEERELLDHLGPHTKGVFLKPGQTLNYEPGRKPPE